MKVSLEERETKRVLYKNDDYLFREPYEISTDPAKFFDEQGPALERMSRDLASRSGRRCSGELLMASVSRMNFWPGCKGKAHPWDSAGWK